MYVPYEITVNLFCFIVLSIVLFFNLFSGERRSTERPLRILIATTLVFILTDIFYIFFLENVYELTDLLYWILMASCLIYYVLEAIIISLWMEYMCETISEPHSKHPARKKVIIVVFIAIIAIFFSDFILSHTGTFIESQLVSLLWTIAYILVVPLPLILLEAFIIYKSKEITIRGIKNRCLFTLLTTVPIVVGNALDVVVGWDGAFITGLTIGLFMVFFNIQNQMITLDSLTGLNDRTQLLLKYNEMREKVDDNNNMYFVLADLIHINEINKTFGYDVGDESLRKVAFIITESCGLGDIFIGRYTGDKFVMMGFANNSEELYRIVENIEYYSEEENRKLEYDIKLSIGIVKVTKKMSFGDAIAACNTSMMTLTEEKRAWLMTGMFDNL